jgi:hypothetical protein
MCLLQATCNKAFFCCAHGGGRGGCSRRRHDFPFFDLFNGSGLFRGSGAAAVVVLCPQVFYVG